MASIKSNFAVGIFVIIGIILIITVVVYVGASNYFETGNLYLAYFDESVQGLSKDSPVKYRGVSVGKVQDIRIAKDAQLIEVLLQIETDWQPPDDITAQLKSIGITGIMFVELDIKKPQDNLLFSEYKDKAPHPVIPTKPSEIRKLIDGVAEIIQQMKALDLPGISRQVKTTIGSVNAAVNELEVQSLAGQLKGVINKADKVFELSRWKSALGAIEGAGGEVSAFARRASETTTQINDLILDNRARIEASLKDLRQAVQRADRLMQSGALMVDTTQNSIQEIEQKLNRTIRNLEETSQNLNTITGKSAHQPSQLFFAAPPAAKKIDRPAN